MTAMPTSAWTRLRRRLGADGNPLRPRSDLIARWLVPAAIVIFAALCPVVAGLTSMWVRADNTAVARAQLGWHEVTAVLLRPVPGPAESNHGANTWLTWTLAKWTFDGQRHTGDVPAAANLSTGSKQAMWLNQLLAGSCWLTRRALYRRRLASWELEWLTVGPLWSRQG
jgi:hypothetical protein